MSVIAPPPSTGKKLKARRVFGDAVVDDNNSSLSYSPSPLKLETSENDSKSCIMIIDDKSSSLTSIRRSSDSSNSAVDNTVDQQEKENNSTRITKAVSFRLEPPRNQPHRVAHQKARQEKRSPMRPDLVKKTQDAINRATDSISKTLNGSIAFELKPFSERSVNQSLMAARAAKIALIRHKASEAAKNRIESQEIGYEAKSFHTEIEQFRMESLEMQRKLSSTINKQRVLRHIERKNIALQKIDEESKFRSAVYRGHQKKLREDRDRVRRMSRQAREKIRENNKLGKEILKLQQIEEETAIHEERYATSVAIRETEKAAAERRRKSFAFRSEHAKRIREIFNQMESQNKTQEHLSYELKRAADKDVEEYKRSLSEQSRKSLAGRNELSHQQRLQMMNDYSAEKKKEHESFELKNAAEKDAEAYKQSLEDQRRRSLANRNNYSRKQYAAEIEREEQERKEAHESFELKRAARKDVEEYEHQLQKERRDSLAKRGEEARRIQELLKKEESEALTEEHDSLELERNAWKDSEDYKRKREQERRESLAWRNQERASHAKLMAEIEALAREKESESYVLKWAGEADAKAYLDKLSEERRKSLQSRGDQIRRHREEGEAQQQQQLEQQRKDEEIRATDHKDVRTYLNECAERDRRSLDYRGKEVRLRRLRMEEAEMQRQKQDKESFQMETNAWFDVQDYVEDCTERRRLSLAFRAKEKRRQAEWERARMENERQDYHGLVRDRLADQRHVQAARQRERARIALEAIRHLGQTSQSSFNPFASILK